MESYFWIGAGIAAFALITQLIFLGLYAGAFRRHHHKSFLILAISCVLGLIYSLFMAAPYITSLDEESLVTLTAIGAIFGVVGVLLTVWGTVLLLKSYRNLLEAAAQSPAGGA